MSIFFCFYVFLVINISTVLSMLKYFILRELHNLKLLEIIELKHRGEKTAMPEKVVHIQDITKMRE